MGIAVALMTFNNTCQLIWSQQADGKLDSPGMLWPSGVMRQFKYTPVNVTDQSIRMHRILGVFVVDSIEFVDNSFLCLRNVLT